MGTRRLPPVSECCKGVYDCPREADFMHRIWARLMVVPFAFGIFCAHRSLACSCGQAAAGTCGDFATIGPSFVGTVIDIENPPDERRGADESGLSRYRFRIDEHLIGFSENEVDVYSGRGSADCSYHFRLGQSYLVLPYTVGQNKIWMAAICNGT